MEPLSLMSIAMIHIGSKYLTIELTPYQKHILKHPMLQFLILVSIIYASTKDIKKTIVIVVTIYVFLYIILNENHPMSIVNPDINVREAYYNSGILQKHMV